jgi:hypothetical protein
LQKFPSREAAAFQVAVRDRPFFDEIGNAAFEDESSDLRQTPRQLDRIQALQRAAEDHKTFRRDAESPDDLFAIAEHHAQTWRTRGGCVAAVLGKADVDPQAQKELGRVGGILRREFSVAVEVEEHRRLRVPAEGVTSQASLSDLDRTGRLQVALPREENAAAD